MSGSLWQELINEGYEEDYADYQIPSFNEAPKPSVESNVSKSASISKGLILKQDGITKNEKVSHNRSRSFNGNIPPLNIPQQNPRGYLPKEMASFTEDIPQTYTLEEYEKQLDLCDFERADHVLENTIAESTQPAEKGKIARLAAESNKKRMRFDESALLYQKAAELDPTNIQVYLDHAKLLDEMGNFVQSEKVLTSGFNATPSSDQHSTKLIKMYERRKKITSARSFLGFMISRYPFSIIGPSILEGILFEMRIGSVRRALQLFTLVDGKITPKSSFFVDLVDILIRRGLQNLAKKYSKMGVERNSSMPNIWIQHISLQSNIVETKLQLQKAKLQLSKSAIPKLIIVGALKLASLGDINSARVMISEFLCQSSGETRWRLVYNAALIEQIAGDTLIVPLLLNYSSQNTPAKTSSTVLLGLVKVFEVNRAYDNCNKLFNQLFNSFSSDWRVHLEYCMFLVRKGDFKAALKAVEKALESHSSNGRLLALRVQLESGERQIEVLNEVYKIAPKSGEIWVEAARICLNPLSPYFNLKSARFYIEMAHLFTPQYVDIILEMVRLEILENGISTDIQSIFGTYVGSEGNYGSVIYMYRRPGSEFTIEEFSRIVDGIREDIIKNRKLYARAIARSSFVVESVRAEEGRLKRDAAATNRPDFRFGITKIEKVIGVHNQVDDETRRSLIFGSSAVFV